MTMCWLTLGSANTVAPEGWWRNRIPIGLDFMPPRAVTLDLVSGARARDAN